jgi:putative DNA primase/helicase
MSIEEIADELARHPNGIGAKYAKRLLAEVTRCFSKWKTHRLTGVTGMTGGAGFATGSPGVTVATNAVMNWPQIKVIPSELPRIVNEAEDALILLGQEFYQRGGMLVRPVTGTIVNKNGKTEGWQLIPVARPYLVETLCCAAQFVRIDGRGKTKGWKPIDAPDKVASALLSRRGKWKLPILNGIVQAPFLRIDGSLCETPGYDPASKLLFKAEGLFPPVPRQPSREEALKALALLEDLISTFPFVGRADRSVALATILTTMDRRSMATAPLFAFNSPVAGTGKSKLVDLCSILATGQPMSVISQGYSEEEFVKCLSAALLAGDLGISIDNCERELKSDFLCQVLTQPKLNIRILGLSSNVETPMNAMLFATGNNLTFSGDVIRRTLMCTMDAGCERPELRDFKTDAASEAKERRGELVVAALTVLGAWHVADERLNLPAFGGFEDWSYRVREALIWLDRTDPCETSVDVRDSDPHRGELVTVVEQWKEHLTLNQDYTVQQVIGRALINSDFHNALMAVASSPSGGSVNSVKLGRWLNRAKGKIVNGLKLLQVGSKHGYPLWKLVRS